MMLAKCVSHLARNLAMAAVLSASIIAGQGADKKVSPEDTRFRQQLDQFAQFLSDLQRQLGVPGMSAAIVKDHRVIWAQGFGFADVEAKRPALPDTPYEIASLTKPLSSAVLLRLVEQGRIELNDPVSQYGVRIKSTGVIRVKHLLGHTSEGDPGSVFRYSGARYGYLQRVIEQGSGGTFPSLFTDTLLHPLGMRDSVPIDMMPQPAYTQIQNRISKPYGMNRTYLKDFGAAAGLVSTVLDLARFDVALDENRVLRPQTKALAFTPQTLSSGDPPIYGLGWFVQEFQGTKIVYHFGYDAFSHLYLKFVDQGYTLILFSNSTALGKFLSSRDWNVMRCPAVLAFYKAFIRDLKAADIIDWNADRDWIAAQLQAAHQAGYREITKQEILNRYLTSRILKQEAPAQAALDTYLHFYPTSKPPLLTLQTPFAKIDRLGNNAYSIMEFSLKQDARVGIYAAGEYFAGKMADYGGIEDVSSGELVWVMTPDRTVAAGGGPMNRQVVDQIDLRPGTYRLHYRTDWGHSFGKWDGLPPDNLFWGIALYSTADGAATNVRAIRTTHKDARLEPLMTSAIPHAERGILWTCVAILLSGVVTMPVLLWRRKDPPDTSATSPRLVKVAAWLAWVNSLLCSLQVIVLMLKTDLESVVMNPIVLTSSSSAEERAFAVVCYVCIALTTLQAVFAVLAWMAKRRSVSARLYYSIATAAATVYLLLLNHWCLIPAV